MPRGNLRYAVLVDYWDPAGENAANPWIAGTFKDREGAQAFAGRVNAGIARVEGRTTPEQREYTPLGMAHVVPLHRPLVGAAVAFAVGEVESA